MKEIIENVKLSAVIPYERNARKNDAAVKEVIKSIERTGYRTPIIVDENMVILCGHTRAKALAKMGWKEIPFVVQYADLSEEQKQEYRIRDNKTGEIAEWDFEILEADFSSDELIDLGFEESEIEKDLKKQTKNINPYQFCHILVSVPIGDIEKVADIIKYCEANGYEYEQSNN